MSGKRTKALRREFRRLHPRAPEVIQNVHVVERKRTTTEAAEAMVCLMKGKPAPPPRTARTILPGTINEFRRFKRAGATERLLADRVLAIRGARMHEERMKAQKP